MTGKLKDVYTVTQKLKTRVTIPTAMIPSVLHVYDAEAMEDLGDKQDTSTWSWTTRVTYPG